MSWPELRHELGQGWELVTASFLPLAVLVGSPVARRIGDSAVVAALLCGTALLAAAGWRSARRPISACLHDCCPLRSAVPSGRAMIVLKTLLH